MEDVRGIRNKSTKQSQSFHGLLLSCRTIYTEAATHLYSTNWFLLRYKSHQSLELLRASGPIPLRVLTVLKIVLNETSRPEQRIGNKGEGNGCQERVWEPNSLLGPC